MAKAPKKADPKKKPVVKKAPKKSAPEKPTVNKPRDWNAAILCAYFHLRGYSQKDSAREAGVGERTLKRWIKSDWWPDALAEARGKWKSGLDVGARRTLGKAMDAEDQPDLALRILERTDPEMAPAKQQIELSQGYISRDEAVKAFKMLAEAVADIVEDEDKRRAVVEKARLILTPLLVAPELPTE